jgi:hypothetical protein
MSVDGLLPDPVASSRDGEDAPEDRFGGQVGVVDQSVNDDVVSAVRLFGLR